MWLRVGCQCVQYVFISRLLPGGGASLGRLVVVVALRVLELELLELKLHCLLLIGALKLDRELLERGERPIFERAGPGLFAALVLCVVVAAAFVDTGRTCSRLCSGTTASCDVS